VSTDFEVFFMDTDGIDLAQSQADTKAEAIKLAKLWAHPTHAAELGLTADHFAECRITIDRVIRRAGSELRECVYDQPVTP